MAILAGDPASDSVKVRHFPDALETFVTMLYINLHLPLPLPFPLASENLTNNQP